MATNTMSWTLVCEVEAAAPRAIPSADETKHITSRHVWCIHVQAKAGSNEAWRTSITYNKTLWRICPDSIYSPAAWTTKPSVVVILELAALAASGSGRGKNKRLNIWSSSNQTIDLRVCVWSTDHHCCANVSCQSGPPATWRQIPSPERRRWRHGAPHDCAHVRDSAWPPIRQLSAPAQRPRPDRERGLLLQEEIRNKKPVWFHVLKKNPFSFCFTKERK